MEKRIWKKPMTVKNRREKSYIMLFLEKLKMESFSWSFRRFHVPVSKEDLVLEVGSGGNPYYRSNVLLDAYLETRERHYEDLIADRQTILGFVENLPFKDNSFDFVIASHVLEHSANPEKFLFELQRVAKAGYIEVPDAFFERVNPYIDHKLEISLIKNRLIIKKKEKSVQDEELKKLYEPRAKTLIANYLIPKHPFSFHVRYYWEKNIDFEILNPEVNINWFSEEQYVKRKLNFSMLRFIRKAILHMARYIFSQNKRNNNIDLISLLRCPSCKSNSLTKVEKTIKCNKCKKNYTLKDKIVLMDSHV